MAKNRLVKNSKGQYGIYDPYTDKVTPITSDMSLVKNTKGRYGFKSGADIIELDEVPSSIKLEETFKKKVATGSSSATSSTDSTSDFYQSAGAKAPEVEQEDPKKQLAAKQQTKQEESQRYIDMFGLGRLDYSGLQKFGSLGEIAADVIDVPANLSKAFVRGVSNGRVNQAITDYAKEGGDLDSDMIARLVKENSTKTGSTYLKSLQEKGILQAEDLTVAGGFAEVIMESMGGMLGTYKAGFEGAVLGGSAGMATGAAAGAIGGPVGSFIAGSVSTLGGAVAGFQGMASYANEYGGSVSESLTKKGYDLSDPKQVEAGLKNKAVMEDAKQIANSRGVAIGMFDAITAGIAGKAAKIAVNLAKRSAVKAGKDITKLGVKKIAAGTSLGVEAIGGSIGEATGQLVSEGKITDWDAVALEGIVELGSSAPTGVYAAYKAGQVNSDLNQENLNKIDALRKTKDALPEDSGASKTALDNKISALEKENKERNKSMTAALQVAPVPATKRVLELTDSIQEIESTLEAIKEGTRTDVDAESRKALWDSMNDMIAERDEIRQEMLKASENEAAANMAPEKPMKPVIFIGDNKEKVDNNNATVVSPNRPLETVKVKEPITFAEKLSGEKNAKPGIAYNVSQGNNIFGTIVESNNNGEKEFVLAETGKKYSSLEDAKFALQEKLTGQRVSEVERTGVNRIKVEGNLGNQQIFIGDPANNNQLDLESKGAIQRAVRALRSVSNANVYLYSNTEEYEKGLAHASGGDTKAITSGTNAQVVDRDGENSIHINLDRADGTTISHEVFHGALLGLAKKDPNAFITMRDKILDRISEKQSLSVTDATGVKRKVSAKEYLLDFQKRYEGDKYTEADRAEEFLSELAGLMSLEDSTVVNDKSLLDSIKLTIKDVLKKFNVEFDSLNELQETEDMVQFFKDFNRSVKTGESIDLGKVQGVTATKPTTQDTQIETLRAKEQSELMEAIPNASNYVVDGKVDRTKIKDENDLKAFDKIYDKYDKLISPLLKSKDAPAQTTSQVTPAAKFKETKSGGQESELFPLLTVKREEGFKLSDEVIYGKTKIDKKGNATTEFYTKFGENQISTSGKSINYDNENNKFYQDRKGSTGRNGEGGRSLSNFEEDYGITFDEVLKGLGIKLKDNEEVLTFRVDKESIEINPASGALKKVHGKVSIVKKGTNGSQSKDTYISYYTPKLKYTDAITGISNAQPEAGTVKESATTRPEGAKKKESITKVISGATDKAKPSVKVKAEPAPGKKTKGNTKSISERVVRATGILGQALAIEPSSARDFAMQFFINGGRVVRGKVTNGAKPSPHSLITLFTKSRQGIYFADEKKMSKRGFLTKSDGLTITQIAHKLYNSVDNETRQIDEQAFRDAVESVLLDHSTTSSMAKEMIQSKGTPAQRSLVSGIDNTSGLDEYELWCAEQIASANGVDVQEVIDNPAKFVTEDVLDGMYDDMLSAFEILDQIQDEESVKQYLEISKPEDLFLDELVAEAAKPEKTLEAQKAELVAEQKIIKKELAAAKKAKDAMVNIGQTSLIDGTQTNLYPPNTLQAVEKVRDLTGQLQDINDKLAKVNSAIEFKERKTIDAFADVVEQKAEESAPPAAPENEEDKPQWLIDREAEYALRDKEDLEIMKLGAEMSRANQKISGSRNTEGAIADYNEAKARRDDYMDSVIARRQKVKDANDLQILINDEVNDSSQPKYEYAEEFERDPLLAAYKRAQEMLVHVSSNDYVDYIVEKGYDTRGQALADQKRSIAKYENNMSLIENAIFEQSLDEQAARAELNNNTSGNEARLAMSKEIDNQLAAKENQLIEKQNQGIGQAKNDLIAIKNGDKSVIDEYVKKSGYKLITKEVIANNPNSQILAKNEGSYYKNLGYQIRVGTAQQIAIQGATSKANSKPKGISVGKNQYQGAYNAILKLSKGEITPEEARSIIEKSGLIAPEAIAAKAEPAPAESSKKDKEINSLQDEIDSYERDIEEATEEIENTKYNYKEDVAALKERKAEISKQKMSRDEREEELDSIDSEIEEAADVRDTYIEQYKDTISEAKKEIKALQKQIDKLNVTTKAQISGETPLGFNEATSVISSLLKDFAPNIEIRKSGYAGMGSMYINEIGSEDGDGSGKIRISDHKKPYESDSFKNEYTDIIIGKNGISSNDLLGTLNDIYKGLDNVRMSSELRDSETIIKYASKLTTKAQISGDRVAPFLKSDPTYKYQMSGTEASLKLIDNIRSKYKMQNTAEEMGMVGKGIRATEKVISDNVVTRVFGGASAAVYKRFANDRANKLIGKPLAMLQSLIANNVRKGLSSQNAAAANASAITVGLIQNLGSTEDFQFARNKLNGGKSVAKNELWQLGKSLNEMINQDKVALRRVHSLLDPEAFGDITDPTLPNSKADLSFAELRLFNILRDMNDYIHEWHYENGFLGEGEVAEALYQKNKGSYFARMYNEIETERFGDLYDALSKLPNAADFSMFKERKDFLDVTENLTLKEDPIYITTKRFGQMMQNQAILQFCDYVAKSGDYKVYKNKEDIPASAVSNYRQLMPKKGGGKVYGELTGKFVPDIVAQQLIGIEFSNQIVNLTYQVAKVFDKSFARQVLSKLKTTWNPLTRAGNITMNFVFASLAGVDPVTLLKNRPAAKESLDTYDSYARDLDANGLLGVSMGKELNNEKDAKAEQAVKDAANKLLGRKPGSKAAEEATAEPKSKMAILGSGIKKVVSDLDQMLTDSYGKSDDVAKVALYKSLVDDYGKTREEAIKIVASSMQNYNTVGKAYDYASKSVNRFVKFKADSARILFNTFKDRPLNLMATLGIYLAAQALSSKISGEDEEERKIREERPYTNKIKIGPVTISLTMKFGNTEVNVARYLAPYSMYDAGYDSNKLEEISAYLPVQYDEDAFIVVNDPLIGPIINLVRDKDFRGMPISDPGKNAFIEKTVTDDEAFWNRVAFSARNYGAPYYGWMENATAAASGDKDYYGRTRTMSEAMLNTVIKVQTVNNETIQRTYEGSLRRLDSEMANIEKTISAKSNSIYDDISDKAGQEGITGEQLDKYIAKKEQELIKFTNEQQEQIDKKILEAERVQGTIGKLVEIKQRKQN